MITNGFTYFAVLAFLAAVLVVAETVSYTHLDVYKRQMLLYTIEKSSSQTCLPHIIAQPFA